MLMLSIASMLTAPPAIQIPEPEPENLETLEFRFMDAFDLGVIIDLPELPLARALDQAKLQWLHSAASLPVPVSSFTANSPEQKEAEQLIKFIVSGAAPAQLLSDMTSLRLTGSQLALWRIGRGNIRDDKWNRAARLTWENRLMDESIHPIIRGYALRHALCWALAENDEERFTDLKNADVGEDMPLLFGMFQKTFASLGGPLTVLRLFTRSLDKVSDGESLGSRLWICPAPDVVPLSADDIWIIPILNLYAFSSEDNADDQQWEGRAEQFLNVTGLEKYNMYFAPYQKDLEMLGVVLFPALVELDRDGNIKSVKMGDACPGK